MSTSVTLSSELDELIAQHPGQLIAIAVHDLKTHDEICLNADVSLHAASTIKVHVMMEVFRQACDGLVSLDDDIVLRNSFTSLADGSAYPLLVEDDSEKGLYGRIGQRESIRELTRLMIVRSSNLATNLLIELVGADRIQSSLSNLGIEGVVVRRGVEDSAAFRRGMNNSATARGLTQTMRLLASGKVISGEASNQMIDVLLDQEFNECIPADLPRTARVAHKTGWTGTFHHDTGIVFPPARAPYAISIMTHGFPENDEAPAHQCMAEISRIVYDRLV